MCKKLDCQDWQPVFFYLFESISICHLYSSHQQIQRILYAAFSYVRLDRFLMKVSFGFSELMIQGWEQEYTIQNWWLLDIVAVGKTSHWVRERQLILGLPFEKTPLLLSIKLQGMVLIMLNLMSRWTPKKQLPACIIFHCTLCFSSPSHF